MWGVGFYPFSVTHAGVGFHASTQPTFILYLIPPTHLTNLVHLISIFLCLVSNFGTAIKI
ncbi:hypothetical protein B1L04_25695 [Microcystis aeruginosa KW]|uniref:Uncharacterized protein n=1 Tax=Microcystis aeruginosa KW TaxID=1960155 RepID=A0A1V4BPA0_MICAE|nr:hypothetical protein B1L04_25695 [Microcystis aeruginosa KW]